MLNQTIFWADLLGGIRPAFVGWHPLGLAMPGAPDGCQSMKAVRADNSHRMLADCHQQPATPADLPPIRPPAFVQSAFVDGFPAGL